MDVGNSTAANTAPTGSATITILDTFKALGGMRLDLYQIERYVYTAAQDQALTLNLYKSDDGVNYNLFQQKAVAAPVAPLTVAGPFDFPISGINFLRVDLVNGGTNQTLWRLSQRLIERQRAAQT